MARFLQAAFALIVLLVAPMLSAQDAPRAEIFGGYSLIHRSSDTMNGWDGALTANLNSWFGVTADVSGHYVTDTTALFLPLTPSSPIAVSKVHAYSFTAGPRFSYRKSRYTLFAHGLVGVSHFGSTTQITGPTPMTVSGSDNAFTTFLGGGIDIPVAHRLAVRPVQAEYLFLRIHGFNVNQFRYSAGLVFRFGQR